MLVGPKTSHTMLSIHKSNVPFDEAKMVHGLEQRGCQIEKKNRTNYKGYPAFEVYYTNWNHYRGVSEYCYILFVPDSGLGFMYEGTRENLPIFKSIIDNLVLGCK